MARPWRKCSAWPYVGKSGKRSYRVGFYDHDKRERTKSFPSARHARAWMYDYITAERRGRDSLRRFLLDLDAKEANEAEGRTIAEVVELFLETDAHPRNEEGLAPATYADYALVLNSHLLGKPRRTRGSRRIVPAARYAVAIAATPAEQFNRPQTPRAWREQMRQAGVPRSTRVRAWRALSSALSWASASASVPEIETNGCRLAKEPVISPRRSRGAAGPATGPGYPRARWPAGRSPPRPLRRSARRCSAASGATRCSPTETRRSSACNTGSPPATRRSGACAGHRSTGVLRVGDGSDQLRTARTLGQDRDEHPQAHRDTRHPARRPPTSGATPFAAPATRPATWTSSFLETSPAPSRACATRQRAHAHLSRTQARNGAKHASRPRCEALATRTEFASILGATPYALRRGGISLRLRTEDPQIVASECGTSLKMLSDHYSFPIEDLRHHEPRPADSSGAPHAPP